MDNQKLCKVREVFEKYNLISGLHSYYLAKDKIYKNVLPPLSLLKKNELQELQKNLNFLNFKTNSLKVS